MIPSQFRTSSSTLPKTDESDRYVEVEDEKNTGQLIPDIIVNRRSLQQ